MRDDPNAAASVSAALHAPRGGELHRIEHYALYILNGLAAAGSGRLTDEDIDLAIETAERLAARLAERGHLKPNP